MGIETKEIVKDSEVRQNDMWPSVESGCREKENKRMSAPVGEQQIESVRALTGELE